MYYPHLHNLFLSSFELLSVVIHYENLLPWSLVLAFVRCFVNIKPSSWRFSWWIFICIHSNELVQIQTKWLTRTSNINRLNIFMWISNIYRTLDTLRFRCLTPYSITLIKTNPCWGTATCSNFFSHFLCFPFSFQNIKFWN